MTNITNRGQWKSGQSGNPKGRPRRKRMLAELLRLKGEETLAIGSTEMSAQEALATAIWQVVVTGEVWLSGRRLEVQSVTEWASVVKWLIDTIEPPTTIEPDSEIVVRVVREDEKALTPGPSPERYAGRGEKNTLRDDKGE